MTQTIELEDIEFPQLDSIAMKLVPKQPGLIGLTRDYLRECLLYHELDDKGTLFGDFLYGEAGYFEQNPDVQSITVSNGRVTEISREGDTEDQQRVPGIIQLVYERPEKNIMEKLFEKLAGAMVAAEPKEHRIRSTSPLGSPPPEGIPIFSKNFKKT